jgi:hypothetical protein
MLKVNLKDKEEAKKYIEKHSYVCEMCEHSLSNQRFETLEELEYHMETLHGMYSPEKHRTVQHIDSKIHDIYMKYVLGGENEERD